MSQSGAWRRVWHTAGRLLVPPATNPAMQPPCHSIRSAYTGARTTEQLRALWTSSRACNPMHVHGSMGSGAPHGWHCHAHAAGACNPHRLTSIGDCSRLCGHVRHMSSSRTACHGMEDFMRLKRMQNTSQRAGHHGSRPQHSPSSQHSSGHSQRSRTAHAHTPRPRHADTRIVFEQISEGHGKSRRHKSGQGAAAGRRPFHAHNASGQGHSSATAASYQEFKPQREATSRQRAATGNRRKRRRQWVRRDAWWRRVGWEAGDEGMGEEDEEQDEDWAWAMGHARSGRRAWRGRADSDSWYHEYFDRHCETSQPHWRARGGAAAGAGGQGSAHAHGWWTQQQETTSSSHQYSQHQQQYEQEHYRQYQEYSQRLSAWWERYQRASHASSSSGSSSSSGRTWGSDGAGAARHSSAVVGHLATLGLGPEQALSASGLKEAFHRCAMRWHPDKHQTGGSGGYGGAGQEAAAEKFKEARAAYEALRAMC